MSSNNTGPRRFNRRTTFNNPAQPTQAIGPSGESIKGRQVFVGNLPWSATSQDLIDNFCVCGVVRAPPSLPSSYLPACLSPSVPPSIPFLLLASLRTSKIYCCPIHNIP